MSRKISNPYKSVFHNYQKLTGKKTLSPLFGSYGGGYPARMNMSYWTPPIPKENLSVNSHHRFNIDLERKVFKDAKFFTSIREPLSMFRSSYNFHYYRFTSNQKVLHRSCNNACWSEPFRTMLDGKFQVPVNDFLDVMDENFDPKIDWIFRVTNFQAFELGLETL